MTKTKKANVVTYHNSYSYGACLQAYASLALLCQLGFETSFVDYRNPWESDSLGKSALRLLAEGNAKGALASLFRNALGYRRYSLAAFAEFHETLPKTPNGSRSIDDFQDLETDLLVVGSDQMWNASISGGIDRAFLLDFGRARRRVSLATSMGNYVMGEKDAAMIRRCLSRFEAVSVREHHTKRQIDAATDRDAFLCLDPTLLVDPDEWRVFSKKPKQVDSEEYLLVFTVNNFPEHSSGVWTRYAKELGIPTYRIANNRLLVSGVKKTLRGITPQEFVWLIDHAAYVVTDSFHGTAFSLNLETPFTVIPNKTGNNVRMTELLVAVGLERRFCDTKEDACPSAMEFDQAASKLRTRRAVCLEWLSKSVSDL